MWVARQLYSQKEYMGAVRLLDKAMVLDPKLVSLYLNHGDCMIALGREIDAELAYKHVPAHTPMRARAPASMCAWLE